MRSDIRFGILGTGGIATKMSEALPLVEGATMYAVASRSQQQADAFAVRHGFEKAYGSYEALINDPHVDVVYIATPHNLHFSNTMMCIDAGKHVLCEKPFAVNAREVHQMIDRARDKGVFLMEAMWSRFLPHIIHAHEMVQSGQLGDIRLLVADFCIHRPMTNPKDRKFNPELIGGALMDIGIYPVFLAEFMLGSPLDQVAMAGLGVTGVDMNCSAVFQYPGQAQAVLYSSFLAESGTRAAIYGEKGTLLFDDFWFMPGNLRFVDAQGKETSIPFEKIGNGYQYEAAEVVRCIRAGLQQSECMSWADSIRLIERLDAIRHQCGIVFPGHD
ncbi:MAG: Gfo/Idh/MocA family oxidoreductase [Marinilabiliaceae bacterium]|nr:Gfo/Idh/MocA family oxidoreductase [Marinilabiliaceae bacterium]